MKKFMYFLVPIVLIVFTLNGCEVNNRGNELELTQLNYEEIKDKLIRFHVIANSDTEEDQNLKLKVRDKVVESLSEKLSGVKSLDEAEAVLEDNIEYVNDVAREVISNNNYSYEVNTMLSYENFPDKVYGNYIFPQGNYEAFRVIIGNGQGQNWWCVMFPSLCFVDESKNSVDSSELKEEIESIESKHSQEDEGAELEQANEISESKDKKEVESEEENKKNKEVSDETNNEVTIKFKIVDIIRGWLN